MIQSCGVFFQQLRIYSFNSNGTCIKIISMKKITRLESSKKLRRVLNIHHVDLCLCQYAIFGKEITLSGYLNKIGGLDFNTSQVESLILDLVRIFPGISIRGELENWKFTSDNIRELETVADIPVNEDMDEDMRYLIELEDE